MQSLVVKRSIIIDGHKTSVSLEDAFWRGLKDIARQQEITLSKLVGKIDAGRTEGNLSSAIRLFVLDGTRQYVPRHFGEHAAAIDLNGAKPAAP
jgi:predicted DNA-binding ribbon-helix-helix protein